MSALFVILLVGATARTTRLITTDALLEPVRGWVERRVSAKIAYLVRCDWCMSVWVGFAVFTFGWYAPDTLSLIVSGALSASLVAGWLFMLETVVESTHES